MVSDSLMSIGAGNIIVHCHFPRYIVFIHWYSNNPPITYIRRMYWKSNKVTIIVLCLESHCHDLIQNPNI